VPDCNPNYVNPSPLPGISGTNPPISPAPGTGISGTRAPVLVPTAAPGIITGSRPPISGNTPSLTGYNCEFYCPEILDVIQALTSCLINIVKKKKNVAENTVEYDFLHFMVGQSHDSFKLLSVKDVMLFQHCQLAIQLLCKGYRQEAF
jgi:hypothetical protein